MEFKNSRNVVSVRTQLEMSINKKQLDEYV